MALAFLALRWVRQSPILSRNGTVMTVMAIMSVLEGITRAHAYVPYGKDRS